MYPPFAITIFPQATLPAWLLRIHHKSDLKTREQLNARGFCVACGDELKRV